MTEIIKLLNSCPVFLDHYNTFHFYFGTTLWPYQIDLLFYRLFRKKVIMEYLGWDVQLYKYLINKYEITNARYYKTEKEAIKGDIKKTKRIAFESKYVDKQYVCAPYLSEFVKNAEVLPLAIDLDDYKFFPKDTLGDEIYFLHAPTNRGNKGTEYIVKAINKLKNEGFRLKLEIVENVKHSELKYLITSCDVFIDQILGGWYGTACIEAMAIGRPTICFIRELYFKFIDYGNKIPIINAQPSTIYDVIKNIVCKKEILPEIGRKSRQFVEEIHDVKKITNKLVNVYCNL